MSVSIALLMMLQIGPWGTAALLATRMIWSATDHRAKAPT